MIWRRGVVELFVSLTGFAGAFSLARAAADYRGLAYVNFVLVMTSLAIFVLTPIVVGMLESVDLE